MTMCTYFIRKIQFYRVKGTKRVYEICHIVGNFNGGGKCIFTFTLLLHITNQYIYLFIPLKTPSKTHVGLYVIWPT